MGFEEWLDVLLNHTNQFHKTVGSSAWEFLMPRPYNI